MFPDPPRIEAFPGGYLRRELFRGGYPGMSCTNTKHEQDTANGCGRRTGPNPLPMLRTRIWSRSAACRKFTSRSPAGCVHKFCRHLQSMGAAFLKVDLLKFNSPEKQMPSLPRMHPFPVFFLPLYRGEGKQPRLYPAALVPRRIPGDRSSSPCA